MALEHCFPSIRCQRLRYAALTSTGAPDTSAAAGSYVSDAQIQVQLSPEVEEGDEFTQKNGGGRVCATSKDDDVFKRLTMSMELCELDYEFLSMLTGGSTFTDGGEVVGYHSVAADATLTTRGCLEVYSDAWDGDEQAVPTVTSPSNAYHHWVFPFTRWTIGQTTLNNGVHTVPLNGRSDSNSNITVDGPHNDWPSYIANAGGITNPWGVFLDATLPDAACGAGSLSAS